MTCRVCTDVGGSNSWQAPPTCLNSEHSGSSTRRPSIPPRTSTKAPQALRFRCSNHRLDVELGRHSHVPPELRICRFCDSGNIGDEFHAFQCDGFMDLQIHYDIHITSRPQFHSDMYTFQTNMQRYISALMSHIRHR